MRTNRRSRGRGVCIAVLAGLAAGGGVVFSITGPVAADVNEVSGSAFALEAHALGIVNIDPTPAGVSGSATEATGSYDTSLQTAVPVNIPGLLAVGVLEAQSQGGDVTGDNHLGFATSFARAGNVVVGNILLPALQAEAIRSECRSDGTGSTGATELVLATAGGDPLITTPTANTNIIIGDVLAPIATAILNEQIEVNTPGVGTSIEVNAVHLTLLPALGLPAAVDIIIAHSECSAQGPDVLIDTTTTTTPGSTTSSSSSIPGSTTSTSSSIPGSTTSSSSIPGSTSSTGPIITTAPTAGGGGGGGGNITTPVGGGVRNVATLARTGSPVQRVITLAFLALVLGGLFVLGGKGLASDPLPVKARARRRNHKGLL